MSRHKRFRVGRASAGLGLFATAPIRRGELIAEYTGRRISTAEANAREARGARYMYEINSRWTVDGSSRANIARYANHSCRPNAESDVVKGKVILRAIKTIEPGSEITYDYGREYFDLIIKPMGCRCAHCGKRRARNAAPKGRAMSSGLAARPLTRIASQSDLSHKGRGEGHAAPVRPARSRARKRRRANGAG